MPTDNAPAGIWKKAVLAYASHLNDYIARGDACAWKDMGDPDPAPDLQYLHLQLLSALRATNAQASDAAIDALREQWPPLHEALLPLIEGNGQGLDALAWLPGGDLLVRVGTWYEPGRVVLVRGVHVSDEPGIDMFGLSPGQQVLALVAEGVVKLVRSDTWHELARFDLPDGSEGLPAGFPVSDTPVGEHASPNSDSAIQQIIPFDDASAVVVVQTTGVFLVTAAATRRLLPIADELQEELEDGNPYPVRLDMAHAAVSPDGRWIACGSQDSYHCMFNAAGECVDRIGPHGEYPHHAAFFADGQHAALNACHFYNGGTIAVDVGAFGTIQSEHYDEHPAVVPIDTSARVYASAPVGDAVVLGDAHGYLWVRSPTGELRWKQHLGGTISAMAVSPDGRLLAVGTYTGTVHVIDLTRTDAAAEQVGSGARREVRRWLFWKQEPRPLAW